MQFVNLQGQYLGIKEEIDGAIQAVLSSSQYIGGKVVEEFERNLARYLDTRELISCANGTDALQLALMALDHGEKKEVIIPAFTYAAPLEAAILLGLKPVLVDVEYESFNAAVEEIERAVTEHTLAIMPVNLYGQACNIRKISEFATQRGIPIILDNAQSLSAKVKDETGEFVEAGKFADISCSSFFPSKVLGAYGDAGAIYTDDRETAEKLRSLKSHGQSKKYHHQYIGVNSRLDAMQAAILNVKLKHLHEYIEHRRGIAELYREKLRDIEEVILPTEMPHSTHVYHQFTIKVKGDRRNALVEHLANEGIPSAIYYPLVLSEQQAYAKYFSAEDEFPVSETLAKEVLSLPIHTEMTGEDVERVTGSIAEFFRA